MLKSYKKPIVVLFMLQSDIVTASATYFEQWEEHGKEDIFND